MAEDPFMPRRADPLKVVGPDFVKAEETPPNLPPLGPTYRGEQTQGNMVIDQSPTAKIRDLVLASIEKGIAAVLNDIDNLIKELVYMKSKVVDDAGLCKDVVANHFNVQAGAIDHVEEIRRNMQHLANGGQPKSEPKPEPKPEPKT